MKAIIAYSAYYLLKVQKTQKLERDKAGKSVNQREFRYEKQ